VILAKPQKYLTDHLQVIFTVSFFREQVLDWMPQVMQILPLPILEDWDMFCNELHQMFSNQHLQSTVQTALVGMRMRDNSHLTNSLITFSSHAPYTGGMTQRLLVILPWSP
jgi:hypothetical protein